MLAQTRRRIRGFHTLELILQVGANFSPVSFAPRSHFRHRAIDAGVSWRDPEQRGVPWRTNTSAVPSPPAGMVIRTVFPQTGQTSLRRSPSLGFDEVLMRLGFERN